MKKKKRNKKKLHVFQVCKVPSVTPASARCICVNQRVIRDDGSTRVLSRRRRLHTLLSGPLVFYKIFNESVLCLYVCKQLSCRLSLKISWDILLTPDTNSKSQCKHHQPSVNHIITHHGWIQQTDMCASADNLCNLFSPFLQLASLKKNPLENQ